MKIPSKTGYFGGFGGQFAPETLMFALNELEKEYLKARKDPEFKKALSLHLKVFAGRPTPLYLAENLSSYLKTLKVYLKREDLLHTGAHKINNTLGQILLARRMGKTRIIAETGAGQHGVATATVAAKFGLKCDIYMGSEDITRQRLNVLRMKILGAKVIPVKSGAGTLKDATSQAMRDWVANVADTHYIIGSVIGPHPFPMIVRDFQSFIGKEARLQILAAEGRLPDYLLACVGAGSNSLGLFVPFLKDKKIKFIGVEAGGRGLDTKAHSASLAKGRLGVLHGCKTMLLMDINGQIQTAHSIAPGLDYPGVGPEHVFLKEKKIADYVSVNDEQALKGFNLLSRLEGIIPALEPSHAIYYLIKLAKIAKKNSLVVVCLSGRGDKDVEAVSEKVNYE